MTKIVDKWIVDNDNSTTCTWSLNLTVSKHMLLRSLTFVCCCENSLIKGALAGFSASGQKQFNGTFLFALSITYCICCKGMSAAIHTCHSVYTSIQFLMPHAWSWSHTDLYRVCLKTQANLDSTPLCEYGCALSRSAALWKSVFLRTASAFLCTTVQHGMSLDCSKKITTTGSRDYCKVTCLSLCDWTCPTYFVGELGNLKSNLNT